MDSLGCISTNSPSSVDPDLHDLDGFFASLAPLKNGEFDSVRGFSFDEIMNDNPCSSTSPALSSFTSEVCEPSETAHVDTQVTEQKFAQEKSQDTSIVPEDDFGMDILNSYSLDDLYRWLADSPEQNANNEALNECSVSLSALLEDNFQANFPDDNQDRSVVTQSCESDFLDVLGLNFESQKHMNCREEPSLSTMSGVSQNRSEIGRNSTVFPTKRLFSQLGIDELISRVANPTGFENPLNLTRRRKLLESSSASSGFPAQRNLSWFAAGNVNPMTESLLPSHKIEAFSKPSSGLWIDDSFSFNAAGNSNLKKPEEPTKVTKKRAKPGESSRPRPKDRQMIQDRIKDLKRVVPNSEKKSIDALLSLTIKHILYMQSLLKYADKLKQPYKPKLINQNRSCIEERVGDSNGVTWAYEVGGGSGVCPIIIEDLNPPGQMLIEMLCEERGHFLEIADVIKGIGLNILKGVMETQEGKIWAHFIVEAKRHVTRLDVLMQLLRFQGPQGSVATNDSGSQIAGVWNPATASVSESLNSISLPLASKDSPR